MSDPQNPIDETPENTVHPRQSQAIKPEPADPSCRRQSEYLSALHQTAVALIDRLDRKELLQTILERVTTLVGTGHGYVYLVDSDKREMEMRVGKGFFAGQLGLRVKRVEMALRKREKELKTQSERLGNVNIALKVLLKQREADKHELEEKVISNIKELVNPYLETLKTSRLSTRQSSLVHVLETNLNNIISPFIRNLSAQFTHFTPMEIRIANLVREGKTNKEMAGILLVSKNTVMFHRYNIRRKLEIKNKKVNLRTYLLAIDK